MRRITYSGVLVNFVFGIFFISTFLGSPEIVAIPIDQPGHINGEIVLTIPRQVFAGQKRTLRAQVTLNEIAGVEFLSLVSSRLELGVDAITPRGTVQVTLQPGVPVEMKWELRVRESDEYNGTLWISVENRGEQDMLLAREIEIESRYFLGTRVENIRIISILFMGVGWIIIVFGLIKRKRITNQNPA